MTEQSYHIDRIILGTYAVDGAGNVTSVLGAGQKITVIRPQVKLSLHIVETLTATGAQEVKPKSLMLDISDSPNFPNNRTFTFCPGIDSDTLLFNGREYSQHDLWVRVATLTPFDIDVQPVNATINEIRLCILQSQ